MSWTVPDLNGNEGELIERFCYGLHEVVAHGSPAVENVLIQTALMIGARVVRAELSARDHDALEQRIGTRALELVRGGVNEGFLVRALCDHVGRDLDKGTDVENINCLRAEALDAIGHDLSAGAVSTLQPLNPDEVAGAWAARDRWRATMAEVLSDDVIEAWVDRRWGCACPAVDAERARGSELSQYRLHPQVGDHGLGGVCGTMLLKVDD